jgi:hypothetical protein
MPLTYLLCAKCKKVSDLVEDYSPGEDRGEWQTFRREHAGANHDLWLGQSIGR